MVSRLCFFVTRVLTACYVSLCSSRHIYMKLNFLLLSFLSVILFSSTAKAQQKTAVQEQASSVSTNTIPLPGIRFVPPVPRSNAVPIPVIPNTKFAGVISLGTRMSALETQINTLMNRYKLLSPGIFFLDLQTGDYLNINAEKIFPAASTIKYPVLVALFEEVDAGRVQLNETMVMQRRHLAGGSGNMRFRSTGTKFSLLETATRMMTISDNTATNMVIERLGGIAKLNQRFRAWGLEQTAMRNMLGDFGGTNKTSAKDLVRLSALVTNSQLLSDASRTQVLNIMYRCQNRRLLPSGLGKGANIAHKTGTLRFVLGDAGIIQTASGRRYLAGILVRRPHHSPQARDFIRQVSQLVYTHLDQATLTRLP
ncbi:beta-lactamase [Calothrix sp. NIES-4071]|nr:beta-lactamase [Calothrix sp. NIES-4071]BAZ54665.1 beta-lactamase [Calothrix sp. NIES-4105]